MLEGISNYSHNNKQQQMYRANKINYILKNVLLFYLLTVCQQSFACCCQFIQFCFNIAHSMDSCSVGKKHTQSFWCNSLQEALPIGSCCHNTHSNSTQISSAIFVYTRHVTIIHSWGNKLLYLLHTVSLLP